MSHSQQLPLPYKRLIDILKQNWKLQNDLIFDILTDKKRLFNCDKRRIDNDF